MPALDHPSDADLQAFAVGALPEDRAQAVENHLAECLHCLALAAAAPDDTLVTLLRTAETSQAGPVTPGPAFAETIGLSQAGPPVEPVPGPPEFAQHTRYRLIRPLGRGGMGHVWLAEHTVMGRPVALKLIRPEFLDKPDAVERFRREVRAAAKLKHPNIVAAHDADQAGGLHFLVMEYIDGETLADRIAAGPVSVEDACRWIIDAARGLEHARENGLIHRDVKPHNLILERPTGRVKVLDFGLAGVATGESSGLTGGNVVIGTPDYISPEQAEDARTADTRSDVYSLGCTLYHLLAGRPPFPTDAVLKKLDAHRLREPEPLTAIRQDMTPALAELVARMLAKDAADRPQTPGEVAVALEQILAGRGGGPPVRDRRRRDSGGRWRRRWRRVAVGALVLVGALAAVAYKLTDEADISVSNEAPDQVKWVIKKDGYIVSEPSSALLTSLFLPAGGEYTVELDRPDEFVAHPKSFAVRRGEKLTIRVVRVAREPQLAAVGPVPPADVGWTDLIPLVDELQATEKGKVERRDTGGKPALVVRSMYDEYARIRLQFRPAGSYEVRATIARTGGNDAFVLSLPVPGGPGTNPNVTLFVDDNLREGGWSGLRFVDSHQPGVWMNRAFGRLERDERYPLYVRVVVAGDKVAIRAELADKVLVDWSGQATDFSGGSIWSVADNSRLALGVVKSTYRIERLEGRPLPAQSSSPAVPAPVTLHGKPDAPWTDLVPFVDVVADAENGLLVREDHDGRPVLRVKDPGGFARVRAPFLPVSGDYEVRARITRVEGNDSFNLMLPLPASGGRTQVGMFLDGFPQPRDGRAGLEWAGGLNVSVVKILESRLVNNRPYEVLTRVSSARGRVRISLAVDNKPLFDWEGPVFDAKSGVNFFTNDRRYLGFGTCASTYRLERLEVRMLSGTARMTRSGPSPAPKAPDADKPGPVARFGRYKGAVLKAVLSPDGRQVFAGEDGVSKWDMATKQMAWGVDSPPGALVALSGDGRVLLVVGDDGKARVLDPTDGTEKRQFPIPSERVAAAVLNRDGTRAFISQLGKKKKEVKPAIRAWDVVNGKELFRLDGHTDDTYGLALSPDGSRVATASYDETVRLWDAGTGKQLHEFTAHTAPVSAVKFSADGKYLVSGGGDDQVRVWGIEEKRCVSLLSGHTEWVMDVAFTPDGTRVVSVSGYEGKGDGVRVWDWRTGDQLDHFARASGAIGSVAVTPDGRVAVTGEHSGEVRVWRLPGPPAPKPETVGPVRRFGRFDEPAGTVAVSEDGKFLYALDDRLTKWELASGKEVWSTGWLLATPLHVAASPDGRHVLVAFMEGVVRVLDANTGKDVREFRGHKERVVGVAVSPDGKRAVSCSGDWKSDRKHSIRVWDVDTANGLFELKGHTAETWYAAYSRDGRRIVTAGNDGTVRVWDATDGKEVAVLKGHDGVVSTAAFSPDGNRVASGGQDRTVRVWDLATKKPVMTLEGHDVWVTDVRFTPDGTRILSVGQNWEFEAYDGLRVWDAATGKPLYEGRAGIPAVGLAVLPDDRYAVTGGRDGAIRVWKLPDALTPGRK